MSPKGMDGMDSHRITASGVSAEVNAKGAELVSLRDAAGNEMLWQAGPEWPRHAPVLFPIVGRLRDDTLRHDGKTYTLGKHGFARDSQFEWTERGADRAALRLTDSAETRRAFPFPFVLDLVYAVADGVLTVTTRVTNPGDGPLPCGVGAHPAFRWPLTDAVAQDDHVVVFETQETGSALPVVDGLLGDETPLPFDGRRLALSKRLFAEDALVMPGVASRKVTFAALGEDGRAVRSLSVAWDGFKDLGIWTKPGPAPFLCIEPWYGMASPVGWDGEFMDKPGILVLDAGATRDFVWSVKLDEGQGAGDAGLKTARPEPDVRVAGHSPVRSRNGSHTPARKRLRTPPVLRADRRRETLRPASFGTSRRAATVCVSRGDGDGLSRPPRHPSRNERRQRARGTQDGFPMAAHRLGHPRRAEA